MILPGAGPASFSQEPAQALVFSGVGPGGAPDPLLILLQFNISLQFARSAAICPSLRPLLGEGKTDILHSTAEGPGNPSGWLHIQALVWRDCCAHQESKARMSRGLGAGLNATS